MENRSDFKWNSLQNYQSVKAYPAIIRGWHFGYKYGQGAGGLPVRIYDRPSMMTSWSVTHTKE